MNAELVTLMVVLASVVESRITATNMKDNTGVLILASYFEQKVAANEPVLVLRRRALSN
jgi:hypothetical protein